MIPTTNARALPALLVALHFAGAAHGQTGPIEEEILAAGFGSAIVSVDVIEAVALGAGSTDTIIQITAEQRHPRLEAGERPWMIPASNMKLLTTGTALLALGADFRFRTSMVMDGDRLVVLADGDPAFADPELLASMGPDGSGLDPDQFLRYWIDAVVEAGVTQLSEVVVDDRVFDREFVHPDWPRDQLNRRYCAQVSGLSFHLNVMHFYPVPQAPHAPNWDRFQPRFEWIEGRNASHSGSREGDSNTAWIARRLVEDSDSEANDVTFFGIVRDPYRTYSVPVTVHNMPAQFAHLLMIELQNAGVSVDSYRVTAWDEPPTTAERIGPAIYTPISLAVERCNRDSENLYAESLLKRVGHEGSGQPGSWTNGAAIVRQTVLSCVESPDLVNELRIADGSGLSRENRVSPRLFTTWLNWFHVAEQRGDPVGRMFIDSLARARVDGTLRNRMAWLDEPEFRDVSVQAKTGYINGVSCLSGYVSMPLDDGRIRRRCFSIMVNDLSVAVAKAKRFQDRAVRTIAEDMLTAVVIVPEPPALGGE